jgi:hypothetical protein
MSNVSRETIVEPVWDKCICSGCGEFFEVDQEDYIAWWMDGKELFCLRCDTNDLLDKPCIKNTDHQLPLIEMYFEAQSVVENSLSSSITNLNRPTDNRTFGGEIRKGLLTWIMIFLFAALYITVMVLWR